LFIEFHFNSDNAVLRMDMDLVAYNILVEENLDVVPSLDLEVHAPS
jgi:hypothetical protein